MRHFVINALSVAVLLLSLTSSVTAQQKYQPANEILDKAKYTVQKILNRNDFEDTLTLFDKAKAIIIFPEILKLGLIIGGEAGEGVLVVKNDEGLWSYPAFYSLKSGSIGLQAGAQSTELILFILSDSALEAVLSNDIKLGGDMAITFGHLGAGVEASTNLNLDTDFYAYSIATGMYAGATIKGSDLRANAKWNESFYNKKNIKPVDIIKNQNFYHPIIQNLLETLSEF